MFKRWKTAIWKWIFADRTSANALQTEEDGVCAVRRGFFKNAAVGAVSITGTAGLAKVVVDSIPQPDMQDKYIQDSLAGEQELGDREYVLMSDQEKTEMVQSFIDHYSDQG